MASPGRAGRRQLTWILQRQENDPSMRGGAASAFRFRGKPPRRLSCPYCQASFTLPEAARSYVCLCGRVLRTNADSTAPVVRVECGVCGSGWGANADAGSMTCHGCGSRVTLANGVAQVAPFDAVCSGCGAAVSTGAYFCQQCGTLLAAPYLNAPPVSPSSPMSEPHAATLPDYTDPALDAEPPAGFTRAAMTADSPAGYLADACWLAELTRRELAAAEPAGIDYFRFLQLMGRIDHAIACLGLAVDGDERFAAGARCILTELELLVCHAVQAAVDPASGALRGWIEASDYHGPLRPRIQKVLTAIAADRNIVRQQTATDQEHEGRWPEPLFDIEPGQSGTRRRANGTFAPEMTLVVKGWAALDASRRFSTPGETLAAMPPISVPRDILAFMAAPPPVRVVASAPALLFSEDA